MNFLKRPLFGQVIVECRVVYCEDLNIKQKNGTTFSQFDFFEQTLIDSWCSISKSVSHISDHGFNCLLGSVISTDKSECVAKFSFAFVFEFLYMAYAFQWVLPLVLTKNTDYDSTFLS